MAAATGDKVIEILANVLRRLILESIFLHEQFRNAIIVENRKDMQGVFAFGKS